MLSTQPNIRPAAPRKQTYPTIPKLVESATIKELLHHVILLAGNKEGNVKLSLDNRFGKPVVALSENDTITRGFEIFRQYGTIIINNKYYNSTIL